MSQIKDDLINIRNSSRFLSRAQPFTAQKQLLPFRHLDVKAKAESVFKPSSVFSRARHGFGTDGQACSSEFAMAPSGHFAQAAISWGSKMAFTVPWQAPTSSSVHTLAGCCWELGDYLEKLLLWAFFIHIAFLRHWLPGLGLEDWRTWRWELRPFWWGRVRPWHTLSPGRCRVLRRPTAQTWAQSPESPVQWQLSSRGHSQEQGCPAAGLHVAKLPHTTKLPLCFQGNLQSQRNS